MSLCLYWMTSIDTLETGEWKAGNETLILHQLTTIVTISVVHMIWYSLAELARRSWCYRELRWQLLSHIVPVFKQPHQSIILTPQHEPSDGDRIRSITMRKQWLIEVSVDSSGKRKTAVHGCTHTMNSIHCVSLIALWWKLKGSTCLPILNIKLKLWRWNICFSSKEVTFDAVGFLYRIL